MQKQISLLALISLLACGKKVETTYPELQPITESVYASGIIKSKNQYQVFPNVGGIIEAIYVNEGDTVIAGDPILKIYNETQKLNKENADLAASYSDFDSNRGKLDDAKMAIELAYDKMKTDSANYFRQISLSQQNLSSAVELEQSQLNYHNSKTAYSSAKVRYEDLKRQLDFNSSQTKKSAQITGLLTKDLIVTSQISGVIYSINKSKGEMVSVATPLGIIGDAHEFILEMEVDENDILSIKKGMQVIVTLDSYEDESFEAVITDINPMMNQGSKTFTVEAKFKTQPTVLYPNMNFEANIILDTKNNALLIPRNYLYRDSLVIKSNGDTTLVKTGLKDLQKVEILSGITVDDQLQKPAR